DRAGRHRRRLCALHPVEGHRRFEQSRADGPLDRSRPARRPRVDDRLGRAALPGGRVMARAANRPRLPRRRTSWGALVIFAAAVALLAGAGAVSPATAQLLMFPPRPKPVVRQERSQEQMLVRAEEINYDYTNERVSAVGNVQLYFGGSTLEADRVIYDQKTKRLHAEGNVQLTEADGTITHG